MKCNAYIKRIGVKVDADSNIVQEIVMVVNGDIKEFKDLMKTPLEVVMVKMQTEFGTGKPPEKKPTHA